MATRKAVYLGFGIDTSAPVLGIVRLCIRCRILSNYPIYGRRSPEQEMNKPNDKPCRCIVTFQRHLHHASSKLIEISWSNRVQWADRYRVREYVFLDALPPKFEYLGDNAFVRLLPSPSLSPVLRLIRLGAAPSL